MLPFPLQDCHDKGIHHFRIYRPSETNRLDWLLPMAQEYIRLHARSEERIEAIRSRLEDLDLDVTNVEKRLQRDSLPVRRHDNFDVVRSDFGELLCYMLLERDYSTVIGTKSIDLRELTDSAGRGIDAIGIEEDGDQYTLVLCEVKVSDERVSPPRVVERSEDSLKNQHLAHLAHLHEETKKKIRRSAKLARNPDVREALDVVGTLLDMHRLDLLKITACNVLVRSTAVHQLRDFGCFYTDPAQFQPASIRFLIACVPGTIDDIIREWYDLLLQEVSA